jgi:hypothetical protein
MAQWFPCPKCGRNLEQSGEATVAGQKFPVFQCDECIVETKMFGEPVEVAFTFAVDAMGKPFDPATEDGSLPI